MIVIENLSKKFKGRYVLKNMSYEFEEGIIYGLYGRNGSGKTMLLRALSGLIIPSEGTVKYDDKILHKDFSFPPSLGVIIEHMELLPQFSAFDNLKILSKINNIATDEDIVSAIEKVGLDPSSTLKTKKYSLGMKQRLNIAQAIFEKPKYILLDEPSNALDDSGVELMYELLREEKRKGNIIIIASHNKEDLHELCDKVIKISEGEIIDEG